MLSSPISVLLVDPEGEARADDVRQRLPQLDVTVAASDTAARAYLGASAFNVVVVGESMPEGTAASLETLCDSLGRSCRVVSGAPTEGLAGWLQEHLSLEASPVARSGEPPEANDALAHVSDELARIAHALNNPLAVIDGNAQLALELSRALGVDASVISAIEDIQGGSQNLASLFAEIAALRERIDALRS